MMRLKKNYNEFKSRNGPIEYIDVRIWWTSRELPPPSSTLQWEWICIFIIIYLKLFSLDGFKVLSHDIIRVFLHWNDANERLVNTS